MISTIRNSLEEGCGEKIGIVRSTWPWLAEHGGFLLSKFEVGQGGWMAYERQKGKTAKVQGMMFAERILWIRRRAGGPLGMLTCMREDGEYLGAKATSGEFIVGGQFGS